MTAAKGFGQMFGLDPRIAFLTFVVDAMLFGENVVTLGATLPLSIAAAVVLGVITFRAQLHWYGDSRQSAQTKALILGLLTAIPTPLPAILYVPAGVIGLTHLVRRK
ncbi:MAG: hypothetical protein JSS66_17065 [Armatimonadetes bacterium]|nr:hypothetical protein [Armatimonadota bacterium]